MRIEAHLILIALKLWLYFTTRDSSETTAVVEPNPTQANLARAFQSGSTLSLLNIARGLQPPGLAYFNRPPDMAQDEDEEKLLGIQEYFSKEGKNRDR